MKVENNKIFRELELEIAQKNDMLAQSKMEQTQIKNQLRNEMRKAYKFETYYIQQKKKKYRNSGAQVGDWTEKEFDGQREATNAEDCAGREHSDHFKENIAPRQNHHLDYQTQEVKLNEIQWNPAILPEMLQMNYQTITRP